MDEVYKFVLEYLILRKAYTFGFIRFNNFRRIIEYATGIYDIYIIRKIFIKLMESGFFIKKKNLKRSYLYRFIGPSSSAWHQLEQVEFV